MADLVWGNTAQLAGRVTETNGVSTDGYGGVRWGTEYVRSFSTGDSLARRSVTKTAGGRQNCPPAPYLSVLIRTTQLTNRRLPLLGN